MYARLASALKQNHLTNKKRIEMNLFMYIIDVYIYLYLLRWNAVWSLGCLSVMNLTCNLRLLNINFDSISKFMIIAYQYTPATRSRCVYPLCPLPAFLQVNIDCVYRNWTVIWRDRMKMDSLWDSRIYRTTRLLQDYLRNDISYTARIFG